jgi:hypothetical protein
MRERAVVVGAGILLGLALGAGAKGELPAAIGQDTEAEEGGRDVPRKPVLPEGHAGVDARRSWEVVASEVNMGVEKGRFLLYNVHSGESYFFHNNADRWVALPFVEGEPGAAGDSARTNLKHNGRTGPTYLPFSAVAEACRRDAAERLAKKKQAAAKPEPKK